MKSIKLALAMAVALSLLNLVGNSAHATVDGPDRLYLVVENIHDDSDFFLERAPIVGCWGLPQGARLVAFTAEYKVPSNIGCGGEPHLDNINALTCAKLVDAKESKDFMSFSEITLDISACPHKNNAKFITMVRTAAKYNFPQSNKSREVRLNLIK